MAHTIAISLPVRSLVSQTLGVILLVKAPPVSYIDDLSPAFRRVHLLFLANRCIRNPLIHDVRHVSL